MSDKLMIRVNDDDTVPKSEIERTIAWLRESDDPRHHEAADELSALIAGDADA